MSGVDHSEEPEQSQIVDERAASDPEGPESARAAATTAEGAGRTADTLHSKRPADGALADERESHSKRQRPEAGTGEHISVAPQVVASPGQDRESVEPQKGMGDDSKRSQSTEERSEVLPSQQEDEKPQGMPLSCVLRNAEVLQQLACSGHALNSLGVGYTSAKPRNARRIGFYMSLTPRFGQVADL